MGEARERLKLNGRTRAEMAMLRPKLRPASVKPTGDSPEVNSAIAAVTNSLAPKLRPKALEQSNSQVASKQKPKPKPASLASNASVAQKATLVKALNLRKVNLIGVYGTSSSRRALIRLSNGRYKKVEVGDRIDGGKVAAIGKEQLRYTKSGRNIVLRMPKS
jgi:type IV pilus biogenesis protein PilP